MNTLSIPMVAMAGISLYVGFYHLLIYLRHRQNRADLMFALLCLAYVLYAVVCAGLYNATSVSEGVQWQRAQFVILSAFVIAFLWFVTDYTRRKPGRTIYLYSIFYLVLLLIQLVDRSDLTFLTDQPSIKTVALPYIQPITYYEATPGVVSTAHGILGIFATTYIVIMGIRYYRRGYKREAMPLLLAVIPMYLAGLNDTLVANGVYHFIYLIEYAYLAIIIVMAYSLSGTVVEAAIAKEELRKSEERLRALVETTSDWVWEVDANGVYTYASPKIRDLLGYEPEEILGRTPFDLMSDEEAERVRAVFQSTLLQKKPLENVENISNYKNGQPVILETSGVPFFDDYGRLLGYRGIDRDITERKRAEEVIKSERQRFQTILETIRVPMLISRLADGVVLYANEAIAQISQVHLDKLIGFKTANFYANPDDRKIVLEALRQHGCISDFEVQFRRTDGSLYWALLSSRIFNYEGETCVLSTYVDITERKRAEQALQAKTEELDRYFTSSLDLLCIADTHGYFHRLNPEWERTLGYPIAELTGRQFLELVHPEDIEATRGAISRLAGQQEVLNFENRYRCKDGSYRWIEWRSYPVEQMIYAVARDITKRKQMEEALRESEQKFRLFVEQSSDGLVFTDEQGIIIEWNQAQERLTGFSRQESIGTPLWEIQPKMLPASGRTPGLLEELQQKILLAVQSGQAHFLNKPVEIGMVHRDGTQVTVQQMIFSIKTNQGYRLGSISRDITKLKQNEMEREALIASLETKNAELERFTYTVSHDLKAPLITIRGFLGYIERDAESGDMNRLKGDVQRIVAATEKMQRLLSELLELSRIGRLMNPPGKIAFGDLVQEVLKLLEGRLQERKIEVKIQGDLPVLFGDAQRLQEVVQNLLDNALKFMEGQPQPVIEIGTRGAENGRPVLYVRDNGMGIAPEHHERIFGLFNKLNPNAEGTGVGLAIVKRIIEVHGGRIWVESEEGKGATFYFTLEQAI